MSFVETTSSASPCLYSCPSILSEVKEYTEFLKRDSAATYAEAKSTLKRYVRELGVYSLVIPQYSDCINSLGEEVGRLRRLEETSP